MSEDPMIEKLAALSTDAPSGLIDRIAARWIGVEGPIGEMFVAFTERGIAYVRPAGVSVADEFRHRFGRPLVRAASPPDGLLSALRTGQANDLDVDLRGVTPFQADVLRAARGIPLGEVRPYSWIAGRIGRPKAVRAVGTALAGNPVPLLIPCHRVIRSDGSPGEYIFGPAIKEELLRRENVDLSRAR